MQTHYPLANNLTQQINYLNTWDRERERILKTYEYTVV